MSFPGASIKPTELWRVPRQVTLSTVWSALVPSPCANSRSTPITRLKSYLLGVAAGKLVVQVPQVAVVNTPLVVVVQALPVVVAAKASGLEE